MTTAPARDNLLMLIVDAHLDLAYNALRGRDVLRPAAEQAADEEGIPSVGLPDLHGGRRRADLRDDLLEPGGDGKPGYSTPDEAHAAGSRQLAWYAARAEEGRFRFVTSPDEVPPKPPGRARGRPTACDPAVGRGGPAALARTTCGRSSTPACAPSASPGGRRATPAAPAHPARSRPKASRSCASWTDSASSTTLSHLAEESFWQLLDMSGGPVMASHSNCRAIVPTDRQLSDDMAKAVFRRDGVVGINFFDKFLLPPDEYGKRRATLADVARHVQAPVRTGG